MSRSRKKRNKNSFLYQTVFLKQERKSLKKYIPFVFTLLVVCFLAFSLFSKTGKPAAKKVHVSLIGNSSSKLALHSTYSEEGFEIIVNNKKIADEDIECDIKSNVNAEAVGKYEIIYNIKYEGESYELMRYIEVVDEEKPVITVRNNYVDVYYCKRESKINLEYEAIDNYDGVITDKVVETKYEDHIELSVKDSSGNEEKVSVPLVLRDKKVPFIEVKGSKIQYIKKDTAFQDDGAVINDGCDTILDGEISVQNDVDVSKKGTYQVLYSYNIDEETTITNKRTVVVYEELPPNIKEEKGDKVVYLTFDDGPGQYTEELLDILKKYDVKVTFFVTNQFKKYVPLIKREVEEGHKVGVHTLTHKWSIYKSVETYIKDFNDMNAIVYAYTGEKANIFRFPGGSSNSISRKYAKGVVSAIRNKMTENGYVYFDWNVDSEDAAGAKKEQIIKNVTTGISNRKSSVVLMHDIKKNTLMAIEDIIIYAKENGFTFKTLDENSPTVHHYIKN